MLYYYEMMIPLIKRSQKSDNTRFSSFLELGVGDPRSSVSARMSGFWNLNVAVDIEIDLPLCKSLSPNTAWFKGTTDEFFEKNTSTFDVIFIDACHDYEFVKRDFYNSIKILNEEGIIFIHDTDPNKEYLLDPAWCGDGCKLNLDLQTMDDIDHITLPLDMAGLSIVRRKSDLRCGAFI